MLYVRLCARRTVSAIAALCALDPTVAAATPAATVVTLITGDRVTVDSAGAAVVRPAAERKAIPFQVVRVQGHTHVIPGDAVAALHAGQLDPRLFDVTELVAAGYDKRATTPVIVTGHGSTAGTVPTYGPAGRSLSLVNGTAMTGDGDARHSRVNIAKTRPSKSSANRYRSSSTPSRTRTTSITAAHSSAPIHVRWRSALRRRLPRLCLSPRRC